MENISPRVDIAFKKMFGTEENKDLLISLKKAEEKGLKKGLLEGLQEGRKEIVRSMLKEGFLIEQISRLTGLGEKELEKLQQ